MRSAIGRKLRLQVEPAELIVQVVLQRLRPGDHVGHRVVLALAGFFDSLLDGRATLLEVVGPLLVHLQQPLEIVLVVWVSSMTSSRSSSVGASGD